MAEPNYLMPPLPLHEEATTVHGPDVTKPMLSPYQIETDDERHNARTDAIAASGREREQNRAKLAIEANMEKSLADQLAAQEKERSDAFAKTQESITAATNHLAAARQKYENAPTPSLFGDRTTAQSALFGLGMLFSAFGDAARDKASILTGGGPSNQSSLNDLVQMDLQRQREKIKGLSDKMLVARTGLADANQARQAALAEVDVRGAAIYKRLAQIGKANLASKKIGDEDINHDARVIGIENEYLKSRDAVGAHLTQQITQSGTDTTTTNREAADKGKTPSAAHLELSPTDVFNQKGDKIADASNPKLADMLNHGNGSADSKGALPAYGNAREAMTALRDDMQKVGFPTSIDDVARRNTLYTNVLMAVKGPGMDALGVLAGPDVKQVENQIGGVLSKWTGKGTESLDQMILKLDRDVERGLASHGFKNPDVLRRQYLGDAPVGAPAQAPPTMFIPKAEITAPTTGRDLRELNRSEAPDLRGMPEVQPGPSAPPGPAIETPANSPDNPNSEAPLPEDPAAPEAADIVTPKKMPGVAQLGKAPAASPGAASMPPATSGSGPTLTARQRAIAAMKQFPALRNPNIMAQLRITPEDLQ